MPLVSFLYMTMKKKSNKHNYGNTLPQISFLQIFYEKKNCPKFGMSVTFWQFCIKKANDFYILKSTFYQSIFIKLFLSYMFILNALDFFELQNTWMKVN
jgi:hypothetical protein